MEIVLNDIGKRLQKHWIFKHISTTFVTESPVAILGPNGSGKSTFVRLLTGMQSPSTGTIQFRINGQLQAPTTYFQNIAYTAPGQEIIEEMTLREFLTFHFSFKPILAGITLADVISITGLQQATDKLIMDFSSGMKQRVKLAQAIFSDTPVLLLDEPCTNLDQAGVEQYRDWMSRYSSGRLVVVASNDPREYFFCRHTLNIEEFK